MRELALFAGAGGGILGGHLLGWRTVCAVEIEDYPRRVLLARQRDGMLPKFPIWDDVRTFDGNPWRGRVDVITGGFPCQDISSAGRGEGLSGAHSGLVYEMLRIVKEVRPKFVFAENSPLLRTRGLGQILYKLNCMGYNARWGVLGAWHAGAPHRGNRMWIRAEFRDDESVANSTRKRQSAAMFKWVTPRTRNATNCSWWGPEPDVGRVANGVADRVDRLKALGNGQVPAVAAIAWELLNTKNSGH
jgi:DNA (cytosine-5)-methyltransferase 1